VTPRKEELRKIVLDILFRRENIGYEPSQFNHLAVGVAEVLSNRLISVSSSTRPFPHDARLDSNDDLLVREIFWDLVIEKVITIGLNSPNPDFPWFRLHSEAESNSLSAKPPKKPRK
jgi:hypothetical protein